MITLPILDTLSRIALNHAHVIGPAIGLAFLLVARHYVGGWPDLWRFRRAVLPVVDRLSDGDYDDVVQEVDTRTPVDISAAVDALPEKTGVPLQAREFVGVVDAPPAEVREEFRSIERCYPNTLASIQFELRDGERVHEVGSYALRPEGFLGVWQTHVRLTPREGGTKTALWAHRERNAWRQPVRHYRADGWDAEAGVAEIASLFASDDRFEASAQAEELLGS